ncbi:MAG: GGDEF domain-containing protein [Gammaproteobacteria bacterium]|nr:GGDEF domain-containing protein [Gammaproteobacteria bacterium]
MLFIFFRKQLDQSALAQKIVPYILVLLYLVSLAPLGYIVGFISLVTGLVMIAAPLFSVILFEGMVTVFLLVIGLAWYLFSAYLYAFNVLPYAPILNILPITTKNVDEKIFYVGYMTILALPHFISFMLGTFILVRYWRLRETKIRQVGLLDSLTNIPNRRAIGDYLAQILSQRAYTEPISIIILDVDFFKVVNDTFGHATGDLVLRRIGEYLKVTLRGTDQVGRYGGEEFLIVLPNTPLERALEIAERCRVQIESSEFKGFEQQSIHVTASFGVHCTSNEDEDASSMIHRADMQLYRAKQSGRNRVCSDYEEVGEIA